MAITPKRRVELFIVRARRVAAHSICNDTELFWDVFHSNVRVTANPDQSDPNLAYVFTMKIPSEEALESLTARVRTFLLGKDDLYYVKVLDAIETLTADKPWPEDVAPISVWRKLWEFAYQKDGDPMGYTRITEQGPITDRKIMDRWLYGDLIHSDDIEADVMGLDLDARFHAAAGIVARIADLVRCMLAMVEVLVEEGSLAVDQTVFDCQVTVDKGELTYRGLVRAADVGTSMPTDLDELDPQVWRPLHNALLGQH